ncbi:MAG: hypothetical protein DWQ02_06005 [Bacteroidetes bacterium]|nr:MAG: hypothetical protein DWQ02_06005 [Bacteroidota bacterium]
MEELDYWNKGTFSTHLFFHFIHFPLQMWNKIELFSRFSNKILNHTLSDYFLANYKKEDFHVYQVRVFFDLKGLKITFSIWK